MRIILVSLIGIFLSGCMQLKMLPYLDQALMLKGFGDEKESQHVFIEKNDKRFGQMLADIDSGRIELCHTQKEVEQFYGPPILAYEEELNGVRVKRALYRNAIGTKTPAKVYFFYDDLGHVLKWEKTL